jgi:FkbM family methyltransferase
MLKIISVFYIKVRQLFRSFIFLIFSENSKIINIFVKFDIFLRHLGILNPYIKGKFEYEGLTFYNAIKDSSVESSIITNRGYEPEVLKEMKSTLNNSSVFIDGGANIGFFSLIASKIVGSTGNIIAFEPTPSTFSYLIKNIKINNINNIIPSEKGLSSSTKQLPFLLKKNPEENSIISGKGKNLQDKEEIIMVNTITIDKFCAENKIQKVDLIKLDIEGQELEAIKGAKKTLSINQNVKIIFELNIAYNENGIEFAKEIFTELKKLNFLNFEALLDPRILIKDLDNFDNIKLLKKITARHNVNILATR